MALYFISWKYLIDICCTGWFGVHLTQARFIKEVEASVQETLPWDPGLKNFCNERSIWETPDISGGSLPVMVVLNSIGKQAEENWENKPISSPPVWPQHQQYPPFSPHLSSCPDFFIDEQQCRSVDLWKLCSTTRFLLWGFVNAKEFITTTYTYSIIKMKWIRYDR